MKNLQRLFNIFYIYSLSLQVLNLSNTYHTSNMFSFSHALNNMSDVIEATALKILCLEPIIYIYEVKM